jgi:hypothetical protein
MHSNKKNLMKVGTTGMYEFAHTKKSAVRAAHSLDGLTHGVV